MGHTWYEMKTKRACDKAVRTTISMPPSLWRLAQEEQRKAGFTSFSDLIQHLIRSGQAPH